MKITFVLFLTLLYFPGYAQKIGYSYDAAGNMVKREIILSRTLPDEYQPKIYSEMISSKEVKIYPNPTDGLLKVDIIGLGDEDHCAIAIFSISGICIVRVPNTGVSTDLDISSHSNGIYILKVNINGDETSWKIIKK